MTAINGVPYPITVKDEKTFAEWVASIQRDMDESRSQNPVKYVIGKPAAVPPIEQNQHRELFKSAYFRDGDAESEAFAKAVTCQQMALELFSHLIQAPEGKIVWRIRPEFDVSLVNIPSDLSQIMMRAQAERVLGNVEPKPTSLDEIKVALGKSEWATNFMTDSIFPVAAPFGEWRVFKCYMRYSVVLGSQVISWAQGAAA